jgi:aminopeptidase N
MRTDANEPVRLEDYRPTDYLIDRVDLAVSLIGATARVLSRLAIRPNPGGVAGAVLPLAGEAISFLGAKLDGVALSANAYTLAEDGLTLHEPPQRPFELAIETEIDLASNTRLMGLYQSNGVYCTQCEAEGFRRITYFLDRPDVLSVYTTRIEADRDTAPILLGNGNPVESGTLPDTGRHFAVWHDPHPKPSYLFALVAGDLGSIQEDYVTPSGRRVKLGIYVEKGKEARAGWAMDSLIRSLRWDERVFGREYDLDVFNIVAVSDFNFGAMENKGLNIFNDKYVLADPQTATDTDYANIESIIAHEYFHNWTGNRITCRDWFQLCLKEGLTVFRDQEFTADERSRPVERIADVRNLRAQQFAEDAGPLAHPVRPSTYREINNFYTATVYEKGAELVRMIRTLIGEAAFRRGMDLYFSRCDNSAATVEDFLASFRDAAGLDSVTFARWYAQAGTPRVTAKTSYDAQRRQYRIQLRQETPPTPGEATKLPVPIPIAFGLIGADGQEVQASPVGVVTQSGVFALEEAEAELLFLDIPQRPTPSLLRGFSAPVNLDIDLSDDDLLHLLRYDTDPFNRWQAGQTRMSRALRRSVAAIRAGEAPKADPAFIDALAAFIAGDALKDPAFAAQVLSLPAEADLAREIGEDVDPEAIHRARQTLRAHIGKALAMPLADLRAKMLPASGAYSPDAFSSSRRALANAALGLIVAGDPGKGAGLASEQFQRADNLTQRLAGMLVLGEVPGTLRETTLKRFSEMYANEPLVLDKWFSVQAQFADVDVLDRLRRLMAHPAFSMKNPNRVRSLIGMFATANPRQFHRADGAGYVYVADAILELDRINPAVSARLATSFRTWRMLEPGRRGRAKAELERIGQAGALSRDLSDIVSRSLG